MERFKKLFIEDRTIGFYLGIGAAVLAIISSILFLIFAQFANIIFTATHEKERTFVILIFVLMLLGGLSQTLVVFKDFKFAPFIQVIFYAFALAMHLYLTSFPLADLLTGVDFFGGSLPVAILFVVLFGLSTTAAIASCFMKQRKSESEVFLSAEAKI